MTKRIRVTGSSGLIGSKVATHFHEQGWAVHGIDNSQRAVFFGPAVGTLNLLAFIAAPRGGEVYNLGAGGATAARFSRPSIASSNSGTGRWSRAPLT
jgi:GDP-D-mannose dehydratase